MEICTIYLDMDEVLTDFVGGASAIWGLTPQEVQNTWSIGVWDMVPPLHEALVRAGRRRMIPQLSDREFWAPINRDEGFWTGLKETPWFNEILDLVNATTDDWEVVTTPSRCPTSYSGKIKWLQYRLGVGFDLITQTRRKDRLAGPGRVLIDDKGSTVSKFIEAGGEGIIFPCYHNSLHERRHDPVDYVKEQLKIIRSK